MAWWRGHSRHCLPGFLQTIWLNKSSSLTKLKCYGIAPSVINWIESYLRRRSSQVSFNRSLLQVAEAASGVPYPLCYLPLRLLTSARLRASPNAQPIQTVSSVRDLWLLLITGFSQTSENNKKFVKIAHTLVLDYNIKRFTVVNTLKFNQYSTWLN